MKFNWSHLVETAIYRVSFIASLAEKFAQKTVNQGFLLKFFTYVNISPLV